MYDTLHSDGVGFSGQGSQWSWARLGHSVRTAKSRITYQMIRLFSAHIYCYNIINPCHVYETRDIHKVSELIMG